MLSLNMILYRGGEYENFSFSLNLGWAIREECWINLSLTFRRTYNPGLFVYDLSGYLWYLDDTGCQTGKIYWNNFPTIRNIIQLIYFYTLKEQFKYEKCTIIVVRSNERLSAVACVIRVFIVSVWDATFDRSRIL